MSTCPECGSELQIGDFPFCNPGGGHSPARAQDSQLFDPVVIHRDAAGNIRYPAHIHAPVPEGFQRVELRTTHEVRRFESEVNQSERAKADGQLSMREAAFSYQQGQRRRELRSDMAHMSALGQDFARHAMDRGNNRRAVTRDVGFHVDVFSNNSSNREVHRDERTNWKGRKG